MKVTVEKLFFLLYCPLLLSDFLRNLIKVKKEEEGKERGRVLD